MLIVLVDDLRNFRKEPLPDDATVITLRDSRAALEWLRNNQNTVIDELWLDHDLGGDDTIMPVVDFLTETAYTMTAIGASLNVSQIFVHSANPPGARNVVRALEQWYSPVRRVSPYEFFVN